MSITAYKLVTADSAYPDGLSLAVSNAITAGWQPFGQPIAFNGKLVQAVIEGVPDGAGGAPVDLQIADVAGLQSALDAKASTQALTDGLATKLGTNGTAAAATKLATVRTIAGVGFDGTANIAITAAGVGALATGGTAAAATKLATARQIAGHAFDGTADIVIAASDVGAQPAG
jgi:hypothetical protein